jgi:hypothetical protein
MLIDQTADSPKSRKLKRQLETMDTARVEKHVNFSIEKQNQFN